MNSLKTRFSEHRVGSRRGVGHRLDALTKEWFEVGCALNSRWLVHGWSSGSALLARDGELPDQARAVKRHPADLIPGREDLHTENMDRRCDQNFIKPSSGFNPCPVLGLGNNLHESSGTPMSLVQPCGLSRGLPTLISSGPYTKRWERPIPTPEGANKTLNSYWCSSERPVVATTGRSTFSRFGRGSQNVHAAFTTCARTADSLTSHMVGHCPTHRD